MNRTEVNMFVVLHVYTGVFVQRTLPAHVCAPYVTCPFLETVTVVVWTPLLDAFAPSHAFLS